MKRKCAREQFLNQTLPRGQQKHDILRDIMRRVILSINPATVTKEYIQSQIMSEFGAINDLRMLAIEAESEANRMTDILYRWAVYARNAGYKVGSQDVKDTVPFAGDNISVRAQQILEYDDHFDVVRYKYKAPDLNYRGRTPDTRPDSSEELLLLQRLGEKVLKNKKKPVYGAIYFMKHKDDVVGNLAPQFEDQPGKNIIRYRFSDDQAKTLEAAHVAPDVTSHCSPEECGDCKFADICNTVFEKRELLEPEIAEVKGINDITLTRPQQQFVLFRNGECRVNAVAGSGKTTIVALRTAALLEEGEDPESILMLTFSEKAKTEMSVRLKAFAKGDVLKGTELPVDKVIIETFNSWGQHLLDKYYSLIGFSAPPKVIDDIQKKDIVIDLLTSRPRTLPLDYNNPFLDMPNASGAVIALCRHLEKMKSAHVATVDDVSRVLGKVAETHADDFLDVYNEYNKKLVEKNLLDYEDQLRLLLDLANHGIFETLPYKHIVIDEFQDSDPNQIGIIIELKKRNKGIKSLVVVGDELQAIYGFRNATPDNLVDFGKYFPNLVDIDMTSNFRSQPPIIGMANRIIEKTARLGKIIEAHKKNTQVKPAVIEIDDETKEQDLFVRQVAKLLRDGTLPKDIAILCRTRAELVKMQNALSKAGIMSILKVPEVIKDAPFVKAIVSLATFIRNPADKMSLAVYAKSMGQDPFDMKELDETADTILKAFEACSTEGEKVGVFLALIEQDSEDYVSAAFVDQMKTQNFTSLSQYVEYCIKYEEYGVRDTKSTAQERTDCVTLITVHSAKGLEWDTVLLSLRRFPIDMESQRLFYVGVTRAKERLLLTYTKRQQLLADMLAA